MFWIVIGILLLIGALGFTYYGYTKYNELKDENASLNSKYEGLKKDFYRCAISEDDEKEMNDKFKEAEDKIFEKIAEERGETLIASKNDENLVYESVDLIFHTLLLLAYKGVEFDEILEEFERRRK